MINPFNQMQTIGKKSTRHAKFAKKMIKLFASIMLLLIALFIVFILCMLFFGTVYGASTFIHYHLLFI